MQGKLDAESLKVSLSSYLIRAQQGGRVRSVGVKKVADVCADTVARTWRSDFSIDTIGISHISDVGVMKRPCEFK